ncbi:MAG TPA: DMT family transporter [Candidatus Hodarchaeales archaeon]|nr:DMT family transporter [Candidatus Hodarchaeales archaeon]
MDLFILAYALAGVIGIQIGFIGQRVGVHTVFDIKGGGIEKLMNKYFYAWILGTLLTVLSSLLVFYSLSVGNVSIVQPFTGLGQTIVALFATIFLKETLGKSEWLAVFLSTAGILVLAFVGSANATSTGSQLQNEVGLMFFTGLILILVIPLGFFGQKLTKLDPGVVEGLAAGLIGGIPSLLTKLAVPRALALDLSHWSIAALIISQSLAFYLLQKSLYLARHPALAVGMFTATSILLPVALAVVFLNESLRTLQVAGIMFILFGSFLLSQRSERIGEKLERLSGSH